MFSFNYAEGATLVMPWLASIAILAFLFIHNEFARRFKWVGLLSFTALPLILTIVWMTVLKEDTYTDWFHIAKVYSCTIAALGFWFIRHYEKKDKITGKVIWKLSDKKWALAFPPLILVINILEAVARDFEIGNMYWLINSGAIEGEVTGVMGGMWNYMNGAAGILNIIAITGWFGIVIRRLTKKDKSKDMLWPDMLWFWIVAYDLWNFAYTYNCIPSHSWYAGIPMLIAPTLCAFTLGKGAWLQHRAQTLAIWCMFAQTFPSFQDEGMFKVVSTYNPTIYTFVSAIALIANIALVAFMVYKAVSTKRNPYKGELYFDTKAYKKIKELS